MLPILVKIIKNNVYVNGFYFVTKRIKQNNFLIVPDDVWAWTFYYSFLQHINLNYKLRYKNAT